MVSALFRSRFPVLGNDKIGFLDLLFDAVCLVVYRSLVGKFASKRPQPRARVFGFCLRFSVLIEICFGFAVSSIFCTVFPFLIYFYQAPIDRHAYCRHQENVTPCFVSYAKVKLQSTMSLT